jgi:hypothetical protein
MRCGAETEQTLAEWKFNAAGSIHGPIRTVNQGCDTVSPKQPGAEGSPEAHSASPRAVRRRAVRGYNFRIAGDATVGSLRSE